MHGTGPISYHYDVEGHDVALSRTHVGTAYARNGNAGNPTEYFVWEACVDGERVVSNRPSRSDAYEHARARALGTSYVNDELRHRYVNVRGWVTVQAEMRANYRGQERPAPARR